MRIGNIKFLEPVRKIDDDTVLGPLVERRVIFRCKSFGIFLHKLCRSDHDRALHTHPWTFISFVLKNGYSEIARLKGVTKHIDVLMKHSAGAILYRPADWSHRVIIEDGKPAWTLIIMGRRKQKWGFWVPQDDMSFKFCWWANYDTHKAICEEEQIWPTGNGEYE